MSHQPFEMWLFSDEPLDGDQVEALHSHLESCEMCRNLSTSWLEVREFMSNSKTIGPAPGFAARWQARLAAQETRPSQPVDQEVSVLFIGFTASIALILFLALLASGLLLLKSPAQLIWMGMYSLANIFHSINAAENILVVLVRVLPKILPASWWIALIAIGCLLSVAWMFILRRVLVPRRMPS